MQLKQEELQLLRPVAQRGQRETKKQALKRALQLQRAGVSLPSDVQLLQERERPAAAMGEAESDDVSSGSDDEDEEEEEQQQLQQQRGGQMAGSDSGSDSDGEGVTPAAKRQRTAGAQQQSQQAPKAAAAAAAGTPPQAEQQAAASAAEQKRQAAALRQAAEATKAQLGVSQQRDEEFPQQAQRAGQGMPAGPGGQPRVVMVQRRPEIQQVRCGTGVDVGAAGLHGFGASSCLGK